MRGVPALNPATNEHPSAIDAEAHPTVVVYVGIKALAP